MVSVSRRAGPPHFGHVVFTNPAHRPSGDPPRQSDLHLSGRITGKSFSGTGTMPHLFRSRSPGWACPSSAAGNAPVFQPISDRGLAKTVFLGEVRHLLDRVFAASPLYSPELISTLSCAVDGSGGSAARVLRIVAMGRMTSRISRPYFLANSKSRSSCAGTHMIAPVP